MNRKQINPLKLILSVILAAALLYFAFRRLDWREFFVGLVSTDWWYILLSLVAAFIALVFRAERWRALLLPINPAITRASVWHGSNLGNLLNIVIPGAGEFYRCGHVCGKVAGYDRTLGTVIMERLWDVLAIVVLLGVALFTNTGKLVPFFRENVIAPLLDTFNLSLWWVSAIIFGLIVLCVFAILHFRGRSRFFGRISESVKGIFEGFAAFARMPGKALFILYTAGIWAMYILMTYFTLKAVPGVDNLTFSDSVFISAVGNIASVIPTPGNLGAYHYLVGLAISSIYLGSAVILPEPLLFATLSHGSHAVLLIFLAFCSYLSLTLKNREK